MDNLTAKKFDDNKPKISLLPTDVLLTTSKAFMYGEAKYGTFNYSGGMEWTRMSDACMRHLFAWLMNEDFDKESSNHHIDHAIASLMMLKHNINNQVGTDNRNKIFK